MERDLSRKLNTWKHVARRKPLLLRGARQTGKTYLLKQFGNQHYAQTHYFNFEAEPSLDSLFVDDLRPHTLLSNLETLRGVEIRPGRDLIIFDEIQSSPAALTALKYFHEQAGDYHLAAAGSLLGIKLATPGSFPVGKVNLLELHPMSFFEFLDAVGMSRYRRLLEQLEGPVPLAEALHKELIGLLRAYYFVGGMPEVVEVYRERGDLVAAREVQLEIVNTYLLDFAKHAPPADIPKLSLIWEAIPTHLARQNKKFVFTAVKKSARGRDFDSALKWLEDTGLIARAYAVSAVKPPLAAHLNRSCFKVYALDVGLLGAMARTPVAMVAQGERLFTEYRGAFVENFVAQHLLAERGRPLFYWRSSGTAEVDFLVEDDGRILPLEVKAGVNPKSKSLRLFGARFDPPLLLRLTLLNLRHDGKVCNIPLYAVDALSRLTGLCLEGSA